ncbi:MAG: DUF4173 domain-containing protein [Lachnospiraceae bacterium]|nr:DUF4173 domain-containing protein [Lachnospiraceae bacterium]
MNQNYRNQDTIQNRSEWNCEGTEQLRSQDNMIQGNRQEPPVRQQLQQTANRMTVRTISPAEQERISKFPILCLATLIYAIFYALCLYENKAGILYPVFSAGTMYYFYFCLQKLQLGWKKDNLWYAVVIELLGISTFLTGDSRIIAWNKLGIFLMIVAFLLHTVYDDRKWGICKYILSIVETVVMAFGCIAKPFTDSAAHNRMVNPEGQRKKGYTKYIFIGLAICIPLVLVVVVMLATADAVFANVFKWLFDIDSLMKMLGHIFRIVLLITAVFIGAYMLLAYLTRKDIDPTVKDRAKGEPVIAITVSAVLSVVYLLFSVIQIAYLFIGGIVGNMKLPEGMSYSQYARTGFFQLLFVCVLNMILVLIGMYLFRESIVLKVFLTVITVTTYIMIASSAFRMVLYIQYKYLTFLRIFVLWSLLVIFLIMTGVLISVWMKNFPLFRYSMAAVAVMYLLLSFSRPDYWIAKVNTDNMSEETQYAFFDETDPYEDTEYLARYMGADAAPVLMSDSYKDALLERTNSTYDRDYYIRRMERRIKDTSWRKFNVSYVWFLSHNAEGEALQEGSAGEQ